VVCWDGGGTKMRWNCSDMCKNLNESILREVFPIPKVDDTLQGPPYSARSTPTVDFGRSL